MEKHEKPQTVAGESNDFMVGSGGVNGWGESQRSEERFFSSDGLPMNIPTDMLPGLDGRWLAG